MVNTASQRRETFLNRSKRVMSQVISQSQIAFSSTLLRPTLLMLIINFGIQFGYEHDFSSTRFIKSKLLSRIFEHSRKLINLNQMLLFIFSVTTGFGYGFPSYSTVWINITRIIMSRYQFVKLSVMSLPTRQMIFSNTVILSLLRIKVSSSMLLS